MTEPTPMPHDDGTRQNFTAGQQVRYVGHALPINYGSVGTVARMGRILSDCPVVHFSHGTHGPHDEFLIITHVRDLEPIR